MGQLFSYSTNDATKEPTEHGTSETDPKAAELSEGTCPNSDALLNESRASLEIVDVVGPSVDFTVDLAASQAILGVSKQFNESNEPPSSPLQDLTRSIACLLPGRYRVQCGLLDGQTLSMEEERAVVGVPLDPLAMRTNSEVFGDVAFHKRLLGYKLSPLSLHKDSGQNLLRYAVEKRSLLSQRDRMAIAVPVSLLEVDRPNKMAAWYAHENLDAEANTARTEFLCVGRHLSLTFADSPSNPKILLIASPVAALAQQMLAEGLVVDVGMSEIRIIPIVGLRILWDSVAILPFGTEHMLEYMRLLVSNSSEYRSIQGKETLQALIEMLYVSTTVNDLTRSVRPNDIEVSQVYHVPGSGASGILVDRNERYGPCEIFFNPSVLGLLSDSIGEAVYRVIDNLAQTVPNVAQELAQNIILTGRIANRPGFAERLEMEINQRSARTSDERFKAHVTLASNNASNIEGLALLASVSSQCASFLDGGLLSEAAVAKWFQ